MLRSFRVALKKKVLGCTSILCAEGALSANNLISTYSRSPLLPRPGGVKPCYPPWDKHIESGGTFLLSATLRI